ncbi:MAG: SufD family Fe-S cluster assembly protein [Bdellovibrionaceae bacterium]|nr:SufD family Fe-S cluster assembly protein [Pseudobdellovibrionaceae bacterium]
MRKKDTSRTYNMFIESLRQNSNSITVANLASWESFLKKEVPTKKQEDWKYTDLTFLDAQNFTTDLQQEFINVTAVDKRSLKITRSASLGSLPLENEQQGLTILRGKEAVSYLQKIDISRSWNYSNYFSEMFDVTNTSEVYFIFDSAWDSKNVLNLEFAAFLDAAIVSNLGVQIVVLPGASISLHEVYKSAPNTLLNVTVNYYLAENAHLTTFRLDQAQSGRVFSTLRSRVDKNAHFHSVHFTGDALWARHNSYIELAGEAAHGELSASYLGGEGHYVDHHTFLDHKVGHTTSTQEFSGVLASKAVGVYNGKVWIQRDAQKSNAEQLSRNLLLSKNAEANTKPELLIDADDVKAKHGATIGQMDQEELFYMQSRGLSPQLAREMVLKSFVFACADKLPQSLKNIYIQKVSLEVGRFISDLKHV